MKSVNKIIDKIPRGPKKAIPYKWWWPNNSMQLNVIIHQIRDHLKE